MGQYYALSMTFKTEPQGQTLTHIKKTYISVQHINFEENELFTEEKKPQMCRKGTVRKEMTVAAILFFGFSQNYSQARFSNSKHTLQIRKAELKHRGW